MLNHVRCASSLYREQNAHQALNMTFPLEWLGPLRKLLYLSIVFLCLSKYQAFQPRERFSRHRWYAQGTGGNIALCPCFSKIPYSSCEVPTSNNAENIIHLPHIERVLCISDLHTDHGDNMKWLKNRTVDFGNDLRSTDLIIVAGDISHEIDKLEQSFSYLRKRKSEILFVPGNHEAWVTREEKENL